MLPFSAIPARMRLEQCTRDHTTHRSTVDFQTHRACQVEPLRGRACRVRALWSSANTIMTPWSVKSSDTTLPGPTGPRGHSARVRATKRTATQQQNPKSRGGRVQCDRRFVGQHFFGPTPAVVGRICERVSV